MPIWFIIALLVEFVWFLLESKWMTLRLPRI